MSPKQHLLIVDNILGRQLAGGEYHILRVVKEWEKTSDVTMVASRCFESSKSSLIPNKVYVRDPMPNLEFNDASLFTITAMIRSFSIIFSRFPDRYDAIISPSHYAFHVLPCLFLKLRRKSTRVVVYFHDILITTDNPMRTMLSTAHNLLGFLLVRLTADLVFTINESAKKRCLDFGIEKQKIVMMSNAVDVSEIVKDNSSFEQFEFDACFLGRLVKTKGVYDLLKVWKAVCLKKPNAKLAVIGDGPEKDEMNKFIKKLGIPNNVILFGFVSESTKSQIMTNSKIFIFPSWLESWGIALAEAMAFELPVVAYGLPIYKEVFDDKLITVPLGDTGAMTKQAILLLENPELSREMGQKGREFIKKYDWSIVAKNELTNIIDLKR